MIDSIKVSEVTDVVTPAEETYPPNYNFSMESTWEEQTFSAGGEGGITPTGTKNITTNGDHDVTNFATAHVDVPTGITPSGSQTFTENGTYDVTSLAEAVVNVSGSGGAGTGKATYTAVDTSLNTPQKLYNALKTATGFTNLYAVVQSELPESSACVRSIVWITGVHGELGSQSGFDYVCYRRATNGSWANATTYSAAITVPAGTEFAVYEIQPYE